MCWTLNPELLFILLRFSPHVGHWGSTIKYVRWTLYPMRSTLCLKLTTRSTVFLNNITVSCSKKAINVRFLYIAGRLPPQLTKSRMIQVRGSCVLWNLSWWVCCPQGYWAHRNRVYDNPSIVQLFTHMRIIPRYSSLLVQIPQGYPHSSLISFGDPQLFFRQRGRCIECSWLNDTERREKIRWISSESLRPLIPSNGMYLNYFLKFLKISHISMDARRWTDRKSVV